MKCVHCRKVLIISDLVLLICFFNMSWYAFTTQEVFMITHVKFFFSLTALNIFLRVLFTVSKYSLKLASDKTRMSKHLFFLNISAITCDWC